MKREVSVGDFWRMAFGETPPIFIIEVLVRVVVLYVVIAVALRAMGARMTSQITRNELLALVSLAAAIGPAVQDPSRGLLPPMLLAGFVVLVQRAIAAATFHSRRIEELVQGAPEIVVAEGVIDTRALARSVLPRERLFATLRSEGITNLGAVERVYIEPGGTLTVLKSRRSAPGLSIVPRCDRDLLEEQPKDESRLACESCGFTKPRAEDEARCPRCASSEWSLAVEE